MGPTHIYTCNPTITAFKFKTGFQSSRRIFKQMFPSRSIFGWYIFWVHLTYIWSLRPSRGMTQFPWLVGVFVHLWNRNYVRLNTDLWWLVRESRVDRKCKVEWPPLVNAYWKTQLWSAQDFLMIEMCIEGWVMKNTPSSGSIVRVKFKISSGSGKCILIVDGNDNSVISLSWRRNERVVSMICFCARIYDSYFIYDNTFLSPELRSGDFLLLCTTFSCWSSLLLLFLHIGDMSASVPNVVYALRICL